MRSASVTNKSGMESILTSKNSENSRTPKKYVSIKELSAILGRSENSLRYHYRMGRIKPTIRFGRTYSFNLDEVIEQLKKDFTSTE